MLLPFGLLSGGGSRLVGTQAGLIPSRKAVRIRKQGRTGKYL
nr:MAG TPA_asm: hypothetical protein [Caudoviricetes sp.]